MELVKRARDYLANNAAESGADVLIGELADEIEVLRATILRFIDLAESYPDSPNDIRPQVSTLGRNTLNLPANKQ
jgi:hypothetical protein